MAASCARQAGQDLRRPRLQGHTGFLNGPEEQAAAGLLEPVIGTLRVPGLEHPPGCAAGGAHALKERLADVRQPLLLPHLPPAALNQPLGVKEHSIHVKYDVFLFHHNSSGIPNTAHFTCPPTVCRWAGFFPCSSRSRATGPLYPRPGPPGQQLQRFLPEPVRVRHRWPQCPLPSGLSHGRAATAPERPLR